jgi:hypothetical protein
MDTPALHALRKVKMMADKEKRCKHGLLKIGCHFCRPRSSN